MEKGEVENGCLVVFLGEPPCHRAGRRERSTSSEDGSQSLTESLVPMFLKAWCGQLKGKISHQSSKQFCLRKVNTWKGIGGRWILCSGHRMRHLVICVRSENYSPKGRD